MSTTKGVLGMSSDTPDRVNPELIEKLQARPDLFEKLNSGDTSAITDIFEYLGARNFASDIQTIKE